jgi:3-hydroxybutyryl-CoA dehydrogenase
MKNIVVIGAGTMGNGIAHTAAASGLDVTLIDVGQEILERAMTTIDKNLQRAVEKGKLSAGDKEAIVRRIQPSTDVQKIGDADLVIEAIIENLGAKIQLFWPRTRRPSPSPGSPRRRNGPTK